MFGPAISFVQTTASLLAEATTAPVVSPGLTASPVIAPDTPQLLQPVLILVLCVIAGLGTVLLMPSRRESALRKIGGTIALAAGLVFAAVLIKVADAQIAGGMGVYFWVFSAIAVVGALRVVTHPRPVYSALYFVLTVMATAGLFVLMWAEFMAAALVLIYAGAILVTYVFVIMLAAEATPTDSGTGSLAGLSDHDAVSREPLIACAVGFATMGVLLFVIFDRANTIEHTPTAMQTAAITASEPTIAPATVTPATTPEAYEFHPTPIQELGDYLFQHQLVNLELGGLILTLAMVGAIVIARRKVVNPEALIEDVVTTPATPIDDNPHSIPVYGTENPRQKAYPET